MTRRMQFRSCAVGVVAAMCAVTLAAQEPRPATPTVPTADSDTPITKQFETMFVDVKQLGSALAAFPAEFRIHPLGTENVVVVRALPSVIQAIEATIKRLDVPAVGERPAELTVYVLTPGESSSGAEVPAVLGPVVTQLTKLSGYKSW